MEYLRGWRAMRQDPQWMGKVGVGTLLVLSSMCIPIVGQVVLVGWSSLMLRRAVSGVDSPLPRLDMDFDYLGKLLNVGFKGFIARFLWSMPLMAVSMALGCCMYIGFGAALVGVAGAASAGGEAGGALGGLGMACVMIGGFALFFVTLILLQLPLQIAVMRAEISDDMNAAMRFKEVMATTRLLFKELLIGHFVLTLIGMVAALFGLVTLYLGLFPAIVVMQVIQTYYQAELYKAYLQKGGQPLPIGPLDIEVAQPVQQYPGQHPGGQPPQF